MAIDPHISVALFDAYDGRCQWCRRPIVFAEMQVDHIFPESSTLDDLAELVQMHGQPVDYDVHATYNLVPSCGPDNRHKSDRPPPDTPIISFVLQRAREKATAIEKRAARLKSHTALAKYVAILTGHPDVAALDEEQKKQLTVAMFGFALTFTADTGEQISASRIHALGDHHDFVTPKVIDATEEQEFYENDIFGVIQDWMEQNSRDAKELVAGSFDHDGGRLMSASIRDVSRLGYAPDLDAYLTRLELSVEYMFIPDNDGVPAPADDYVTMDVWVELDASNESVVSIVADYWGSFGD